MTYYCHICGQPEQSYDVIDPTTGEKVGEEIACPDAWRESHDVQRT